MTAPALPGAAPDPAPGRNDPARLPPEVEEARLVLRRKMAECGVDREIFDTLWSCDVEPILAALGGDGEPVAADRPEVVCLCGSTRFIDTFQAQYGRLTDEGKIVLTVGRVVPQSEQALGSQRKVALDTLHLRKIDLADRVLVLNVGGYVGPSTRREIEYAKAHGKPIDLLHPDAGLEGPAPAATGDTGEVEKARAAFYEAAMHAIGCRAAYGPDHGDAMNPSTKVHAAWRRVVEAETAATGDHPSEARRGHESEGRGGPDAR